MGGDFAAIAAALTRTPAPHPRGSGNGSTAPSSGNTAAQSGQRLPVRSPPPPPPVVDVAKAVERLNELMTSHQRSLRFSIDASSGRTVITVINDATNEIVRQIPAPELLRIAHNLDDLGSLIDAHV
jgi:flagellar protein FlaG